MPARFYIRSVFRLSVALKIFLMEAEYKRSSLWNAFAFACPSMRLMAWSFIHRGNDFFPRRRVAYRLLLLRSYVDPARNTAPRFFWRIARVFNKGLPRLDMTFLRIENNTVLRRLITRHFLRVDFAKKRLKSRQNIKSGHLLQAGKCTSPDIQKTLIM